MRKIRFLFRGIIFGAFLMAIVFSSVPSKDFAHAAIGHASVVASAAVGDYRTENAEETHLTETSISYVFDGEANRFFIERNTALIGSEGAAATEAESDDSRTWAIVLSVLLVVGGVIAGVIIAVLLYRCKTLKTKRLGEVRQQESQEKSGAERKQGAEEKPDTKEEQGTEEKQGTEEESGTEGKQGTKEESGTEGKQGTKEESGTEGKQGTKEKFIKGKRYRKIDRAICEINESLNELKNRVNELKNRASQFDQQLTKFDGEIDKLFTVLCGSEPKSKDEDKLASSEQVKELRKKNTQLDGQVKELRKKNTQLDGQVKELKKKNTQLDGRVKKLSEENEELKAPRYAGRPIEDYLPKIDEALKYAESRQYDEKDPKGSFIIQRQQLDAIGELLAKYRSQR